MRFSIWRASDSFVEPEPSPCSRAERYGEGRWSIEIENLSDLVALVDEVGQIIFGGTFITIYDDYME